MLRLAISNFIYYIWILDKCNRHLIIHPHNGTYYSTGSSGVIIIIKYNQFCIVIETTAEVEKQA